MSEDLGHLVNKLTVLAPGKLLIAIAKGNGQYLVQTPDLQDGQIHVVSNTQNGLEAELITQLNTMSLGDTPEEPQTATPLASNSESTRRGLRNTASEGNWHGGPAPYGYTKGIVNESGQVQRVLQGNERKSRYDRVKLVPNDNAETVRLIYTLYGLREQGMLSIAEELARRNIPNPSGRVEWHKSTIRNILTNDAYTGKIVYQKGTADEIITENAHEAIVTQNLFDVVQARIDSTKFGERGGRTTPYLLTTLVQCAQCGANFTGCTHNEQRAYRCGSYATNASCTGKRHPIEGIEQPVVNYVLDQITSENWPELVQEALRYASNNQQLSDIESQRDQNKAQIEQLVNGAVSNERPRAVNQRITVLEQEQARLEKELTHYKKLHVEVDALNQHGNDFDVYWENASIQEKKKIVQMFLKNATLEQNGTITYTFYTVPNLNGQPNIPTTSQTLHLYRRETA